MKQRTSLNSEDITEQYRNDDPYNSGRKLPPSERRPGNNNATDEDITLPMHEERQELQPQQQQQQQQQQPGNASSAEAIKGKWKQKMGAAKAKWGKLTDDELLEAEGNADKLAGLVQERYAVSRDEAKKQVENFTESSK